MSQGCWCRLLFYEINLNNRCQIATGYLETWREYVDLIVEHRNNWIRLRDSLKTAKFVPPSLFQSVCPPPTFFYITMNLGANPMVPMCRERKENKCDDEDMIVTGLCLRQTRLIRTHELSPDKSHNETQSPATSAITLCVDIYWVQRYRYIWMDKWKVISDGFKLWCLNLKLMEVTYLNMRIFPKVKATYGFNIFASSYLH